MKHNFFAFCITFLSLSAVGQQTYDFTTKQSRTQHNKKLVDTVINGSLRAPLSAATEKEWRSAFWAMELMLYKTPQTKTKLQEAWNKAQRLSETFQKALLEVSFTLYPTAFRKEATKLLRNTASPAVFVRCAEYLLRSSNKEATHLVEQQLAHRFHGNDFHGFALLQERLRGQQRKKRPPFRDLFSKKFLPGKTVIFSLQRSNRDYPGVVIIRDADGCFLRNSDGRLFYTTQLARSITNYPFYLTNGNTPQGLFRWTGFDTSSITYIGPTPNLQLVMPMEASTAVFFGNSSLRTAWTKELYASLLPPSWRSDKGIYESWWTGKMGRSEIIMHGTTIDPRYYKGQPYFPQTPSLGCLCSYEEWNSAGQRVTSNQQQLVDALTRIGSHSGYVVVIEIDEQQRAVSMADVGRLLSQ